MDSMYILLTRREKLCCKKDNATPLFDWGKYYEKKGRIMMPISAQVHHSFVDLLEKLRATRSNGRKDSNGVFKAGHNDCYLLRKYTLIHI